MKDCAFGRKESTIVWTALNLIAKHWSRHECFNKRSCCTYKDKIPWSYKSSIVVTMGWKSAVGIDQNVSHFKWKHRLSYPRFERASNLLGTLLCWIAECLLNFRSDLRKWKKFHDYKELFMILIIRWSNDRFLHFCNQSWVRDCVSSNKSKAHFYRILALILQSSRPKPPQCRLSDPWTQKWLHFEKWKLSGSRKSIFTDSFSSVINQPIEQNNPKSKWKDIFSSFYPLFLGLAMSLCQTREERCVNSWVASFLCL